MSVLNESMKPIEWPRWLLTSMASIEMILCGISGDPTWRHFVRTRDLQRLLLSLEWLITGANMVGRMSANRRATVGFVNRSICKVTDKGAGYI